MSRTSVRHADLVARALGELQGEEQARIDRALAADDALRRQFEEIAGHLLQYDQVPPAPPAPPFGRIADALDREHEPDLAVLKLRPEPRARTPLAAVCGGLAVMAAAVLVAVMIWRPWDERRTTDSGLHIVPGVGMELVRDGRALPAPARGHVAVAVGDVLRCDAAAEARFGDRVRVVLDGGGRLRIDGAEAVTLTRGRAWFEVAPGAFEVRTAHGPVRVLGTAFEVDVRAGALAVSVGHGRVEAAGVEVATGERLAAGRLRPLGGEAGAWFRRPALRLEQAARPRAGDGRLALRLVFHNAGNVPLTLPGPSGARRALWLSFETLEGRVLREQPVLEADVQAGLEVLRPGSALRLEPGGRHVVTLEILPPVGSPGAYRCRALFRPAGQPGVISTPLDVEVR